MSASRMRDSEALMFSMVTPRLLIAASTWFCDAPSFARRLETCTTASSTAVRRSFAFRVVDTLWSSTTSVSIVFVVPRLVVRLSWKVTEMSWPTFAPTRKVAAPLPADVITVNVSRLTSTLAIVLVVSPVMVSFSAWPPPLKLICASPLVPAPSVAPATSRSTSTLSWSFDSRMVSASILVSV